MAKLYVVGIGPGGRGHFTVKALEAIKKIDLIVDLLVGKEVIKNGMKGEIEDDFIDMMTVIIGNSQTYIKDGKMVTPRGYNL